MILDELWITGLLTAGGIVFVSVFGGAILGVLLGTYLPEHHLSTESKDFVRLGIGLLATMSALVLGLLIASADPTVIGTLTVGALSIAGAIFVILELDRPFRGASSGSRACPCARRSRISGARTRV